MPNQMSRTTWMLLLMLSIFWGGSFFFVEIALEDIPPFTLVFLRVFLAAIVLLLILYAQGCSLPRDLLVWRKYFLMGLISNAIPFCLIVWGQTHIESSVASILNATTPICTVILAHWMTTDERLSVRKLAAVILGFIGVYFLMRPELQNGMSWKGYGQLAVVAASICYSFAGIFGKSLKIYPPLNNAAGTLCCSALMLFPFVILIDSPWTLQVHTPALLAVLGYSLISTALAFWLFFRILAVAGVVNTQLVTFLVPLNTLILGVGVLGERLYPSAFVGMGFIFLGLIVIDGRVMQFIRKRVSKSKSLKASEEEAPAILCEMKDT